MKSPIYYGASVEKKDGVIKSFNENSLIIGTFLDCATLEDEMVKYPLESIVESLTQLFGNEADAKNVLITLYELSVDVVENKIDLNLLLPAIHTISALPYFTEKIKELETTVENLQYALANK